MKLSLPDIRHDKSGFEALVDLYAQAKELFFDNIEIDMRQTFWFDADMCSAFGAVLYSLSDNINTVKLSNITPRVEEILSKNGFLSHYGHKKIPDNFGTTIPYKRFDVKDDRYFADYVESEFVSRSEIPAMSDKLKKKFQKNIFEIFSNAVSHSQTKLGIYSCGQLFPKQHKLDFSITDLGIGMCQNIKDSLGYDLSPDEAIIWATSKHNTTRSGSVPGGLGLKLLSEFIDLNKGRIQIVSDAGYWKRENKEVTTDQLKQPFPGTVVNIEINTSDSARYKLASELTPADIF